MNPEQAIKYGISKVTPVMEKYGFFLAESEHGSGGSGGPFARAKYNNGERSFEFHFRYSLGLVSYAVGSISADHEDVAWALGHTSVHYPIYSDSPEVQFEALVNDIENVTEAFFSDSELDATELLIKAKQRPKGFQRLSDGTI